MGIAIGNRSSETIAGENRAVGGEPSVEKAGGVSKPEAAGVLGGEGLVLSEQIRELVRSVPIEDAAALLEMMQKVYESQLERLDSLKPSDEMIELQERRLEEIRELMRQTQDKKIDFAEALKRFTNMLPPDLVSAFDAAIVKVALRA